MISLTYNMGNALYKLEYDDLNFDNANPGDVKLFIKQRTQVDEDIIVDSTLSDLQTPSPNFEPCWRPW